MHLFPGQYGLDFKIFWIVAHSLHELTFLAALFLNWKIASRRNVMIVVLVIHAVVRAWTLLYFAPAIISFQQTPFSETIDQTLQAKAALWRNLNLVEQLSRYGNQTVQIKRGLLHGVLRRAAREAGITVEFGKRLVSVTQNEENAICCSRCSSGWKPGKWIGCMAIGSTGKLG